MTLANPWFLAALLGVVLVFHLDLVVALLNLAQFGKPLPGVMRRLYDDERLERCREYHLQSTKVDLLRESVALAALLVFWLAGGFAWLQAWTGSLGWNPVASGTLAVALITLAGMILGLPFAAWQTFGVEAEFGFNRTTPATFVKDEFKTLLLLALLGLPLLALIIWLFETVAYAALAAWAAVALFTLVMTWVSPRFILPLFLRFDPLPDGELRDSILALARRLEFPVADVSVVDGSRRSTKANAFFAGFGRAKRIALYDTLVESHTQDELLAVLAHEIGHNKRGHVIRHLVLSLAESAVMFALLHFALRSPGFFAAFGLTGTPAGLGLAVFPILYKPLSLLLTLPAMRMSRRHEYEADAFARAAMGSPAPLAAALEKLSTDHLSHPAPHPLAIRLHHSHPPLAQRLAALTEKAA